MGEIFTLTKFIEGVVLVSRRVYPKLKNFHHKTVLNKQKDWKDDQAHFFSVRGNQLQNQLTKLTNKRYLSKSIKSTIQLKNTLTKRPKMPKYYNIGCRKGSVFRARLRIQCSSLNDHLFSRHLTEDRSCDCGTPVENSEHYLLQCPMYNNIRNQFIRPNVQIDTLLYGDSDLGLDINKTYSME